MSDKIFLTHSICYRAAMKLASQIHEKVPNRKVVSLYGVPRGGIPAAYLVAQAFAELGHSATLTDSFQEAEFIIDDIVDSGKTKARYATLAPSTPFLALSDFMLPKPPGSWLVFPWEVQQEGRDGSADDCIVRLLQFIGDDPNREGLRDTPKRVLKAWQEMTVGYRQDPKVILQRDFESRFYDQVIACPWVEFHSVCEHHLLPFFGYAHVGYLPSSKQAERRVVGLSKLARLVDCFARRLQIQEQMTVQIANALEEVLAPDGVAVVVQAKHLCMSCRGVQKHKASMVTSSMRGCFRNDGPARQEFFKMIELAKP